MDIKWFHRPVIILIAILLMGPFALPLVWASPALGKTSKALVTVIVLIITAWLMKGFSDIYKDLLKNMTELDQVLGK